MQNIVKGLLSTISFSNPLLKDHDVGPLVTTSLAWKVFSGVKRATNEDVAIFIFDKRLLERLPKQAQDAACAIVRRDAQTLTKLRHPSILRVLSPLEETKSDMVVITEPVLYTLQMICTSKSIPQMDYVEIKKCAYDVTDGMYFLHDAARVVHRRLCPETIFCSDKGEWKIGGFGFSYPIDSPDPPLDIREYERNPNLDLFQFIPNTEFLAPEIMSGLVAGPTSDTYALGRVICYMLAHTDAGDPITESGRSAQEVFRMRVERVLRDPAKSEFLRPLLLPDASMRSNADMFLRSAYFQDTNTRVLLFLRNFVQQDDSNKQQFLKGLQTAMHNFSPRTCSQHVLPPLVADIKNSQLVPALLTNIFLASQSITSEEFHKIVLPSLLPMLKAGVALSQSVYVILLENLPIMFSKCKPDITTQYLIPFLIRSLSVNKIEIIGEALTQLPKIIGTPALNSETVRSGILPKLQFICQHASSEQLKVRTLACFAKLVPIMERYLTLEFVMPSLSQLSQSDRSLPISLGLISVYEVVVQQFDADLLGGKLLPSLLPLTVDKSMNIDQFNVVMRIVKLAIQKLEQERISELSKQRVDNAVPLSETAAPQEWESFEQAQTRILTDQSTINLPALLTAPKIPSPTRPIAQPPTKQAPKPSPTPSIPPISAISGKTSPPTSPASNFAFTISPPQSPSTPSNLFVGMETKVSSPAQDSFASFETKKPATTSPTTDFFADFQPNQPKVPITTSSTKDPFASLNDLQDIMKARPMTTPITPQKPITPTSPIKPPPKLNPPPSSTSAPPSSSSSSPSSSSSSSSSIFSLVGLQMNPPPPPPSFAEPFATQLNMDGDPFAANGTISGQGFM
eukprot:Phypoly_transcript_02883.p1 GENE.Phypoly_transcript_02883~~Phypoly_transcript_02883.p1  ORF type:complete len:854 (+),score=156.21 Phypoly_transcript_02883:57-2618(+)